jgi:hypothetical protein
MDAVGRVLVGAGFLLVCVGAIVMLLERFHIGLGRLPGDIVMRSRGVTIYVPVVTCIVLSLLATLVMWLVNRR